MCHDFVQQFVVDWIDGRTWQLADVQMNGVKHFVHCSDCIVIEFQPRMNGVMIVMQPSVKVGGNNVSRFLSFLCAFFVLFEQFQR